MKAANIKLGLSCDICDITLVPLQCDVTAKRHARNETHGWSGGTGVLSEPRPVFWNSCGQLLSQPANEERRLHTDPDTRSI